MEFPFSNTKEKRMGGLKHTTVECMLGNVHHSTNHGLLPEFEQRLNTMVQVKTLLRKSMLSSSTKSIKSAGVTAGTNHSDDDRLL